MFARIKPGMNREGGKRTDSVKWVGKSILLTLPLVASFLTESFQVKVGLMLWSVVNIDAFSTLPQFCAHDMLNVSQCCDIQI